MAFAQIGDVRIFYTDEGAGDPPLLFVHGYTCDSHDWSWQLPHFRTAHREIAVDLRGHGHSSAPPDGYSTQQFAADLAGLLDHLGTGPVVAIGHSMGGSVVSALAVEHPKHVRAVVAVDPAYLLPDETIDAVRPIVTGLAGTDPVPVVQQLIGGLTSPATDPALHTWRQRRIAGTDPGALRLALDAQLGTMASYSASAPYLRRRACPVLSFYADPDRVAVEQEIFADPRSRAIGWAGSGHWLHHERPQEFNSLVSDWLAGLDG